MSAARAVLACVAALLLAGCSATQFAYRNADTLLRWQASGYLDVHGAQSDELDARIAALTAWHRARALPQYVGIVEEAAKRVARGLSREDLLWSYDSLRAQGDEALRRASAEFAPLLDSLDAAQIRHLEQRLAEDNRKFAKEQLAGTPEERARRRLKRNVERLEEWLGDLSDAQLERVRRYSERAPFTAEHRDRYRKRRQAEFLAMLRAREAGRRLADWAAGWERERDPAYAAASRALQAELESMLLDLDRTLSPVQRRHAVARLQAYAKDFGALVPSAEARSAPK